MSSFLTDRTLFGSFCCYICFGCTFQFFIDVLSSTNDLISKLSQESKFYPKLHTSSEFFDSSVTLLTCCDRQIFAKWLKLLKFSHDFLMAGQLSNVALKMIGHIFDRIFY